MRRASRLRATLAALTVTALAGAGLAAPSASAAEATPPTNGLIAWYKLDETSGTTAANSAAGSSIAAGTVQGTASWNAGSGFSFSGGASSAGNAIQLPDNIAAGLDDLTVSFDVQVDATLTGNYFMFNLGNLASYPNGTGYIFVTGTDSSSRYRGTIATAGYATEASAYRTGGLTTGTWKHVTMVIDGGTVANPGSIHLYEGENLVASNTSYTASPASIVSSTRNFLGRSAYAGDNSFKGLMKDFRLYNRALAASEVGDAANTAAQAKAAAGAAELTVPTVTETNLTLASKASNGAKVTWATDNASVIAADGTVTQPPNGQPAATATLTATANFAGMTSQKAFPVSVTPAASPEQRVAADLAALSIANTDAVRGNLTLPIVGAVRNSTISWTSSPAGMVSSTGVVTRPAYGQPSATVTLTATATYGAATDTRAFTLTVLPLPKSEETSAYVFAYFTGESTATGERIYLGASKGNDALRWNNLNDGDAVLTSTEGEKGLRDPFIMRSHEGDKFYMIATDLNMYALYGQTDFSAAQQSGSKYLEIWESTDLVNWSAQRHVKVSTDYAGNTWAPEAYYDETIGAYVVYWASNLYDTTTIEGRSYTSTYNRMMYSTTRDFVTFTPAQPWIDVKRGTGKGMIDSTVIKEGTNFYRFTKDEASMTVREEVSTDLRATVSGSTLPTTTSTPGWSMIKEGVGVGEPNPQATSGIFTNGEGPTIFKANTGDVNTGGVPTWYLFQDQPSYHGGKGYVPFTSTNLAAGTWTSVAATAQLPTSPRHGTVLPVTRAEYEYVLSELQPDLLATSAEAVTTTTRQGVAPTLPEKVDVTYKDGSVRATSVTWPTLTPAQYAAPTSFVVTGILPEGSQIPVTATIKVTDSADPIVVVSAVGTAGTNGWFVQAPTATVQATDENSVAKVETSLDGAVWQETAGAIATVPVSVDGIHAVVARATDASGNVSTEASSEVKVDTAAPVTRPVLDLGARKVALRAADETSGVASTEYRVGSGAWQAYTGDVTIGSGQITVGFRSTDLAGNAEPAGAVVVPAAGAGLSESVTAAVVGSTTQAYGTSSKVVVRVSGAGTIPTGTVRVLDGNRLVGSGKLTAGRTTIALAKDLAVGTKTLSIVYSGDATYAASTDSVAVRIVKAASKVKVSTKIVKTRAARKKVRATVTVSSSTGVKVAGKVLVKVTRKSKGKTRTVTTKTVTIAAKSGTKATVTLPKKLAKGSYKVTVSFTGSSTVSAAAVTVKVTVT